MSEVIRITKEEAKDLVENYKGDKFFSVTFVKRGNGEIRKMNCRKGVKKHLKDGEKKYNPAEKQLVCVFDVGVEGYRSIPLDNIKHVKIEKKEYSVL